MEVEVVVTQEQVNDVMDAVIEQTSINKTKFSGMTYEDGVRAAIDWMTGEDDENPMAD